MSHIERKHNIRCADYKATYGPGPLLIYTDSHKEHLSNKQREWISKPENKARYKEYHRSIWQERYWTEKGCTRDEARKIVSEKQTRVVSDTTKKLLSSLRIGSNNSMSLESIGRRHGVTSEEARKLTPMFGKHHTEQTKSKIAAAVAVCGTVSTGEEELRTVVIGICGQKIRTNVALGSYNVDIVVDDKRLVVEFFGDHWHMNPNKYSHDQVNVTTKRTARQQWDKDQKKIDHISSLGYKVLVVWENDLNWNSDKVIKDIRDAINQ